MFLNDSLLLFCHVSVTESTLTKQSLACSVITWLYQETQQARAQYVSLGIFVISPANTCSNYIKPKTVTYHDHELDVTIPAI